MKNSLCSLAALTLVLSACGGGSSSSDDMASSSSFSSSSSSASSGEGTPSVSGLLQAQPLADRSVVFDLSASGEIKSIPTWGLDTAWYSRDNVLRGAAFMGNEQVDVVRISFTATAPLENGELPTAQANLLEGRLDIVDLIAPDLPVTINEDSYPSIDPYFRDGNPIDPVRWIEIIKLTAQRAQERGHPVTSIAPFNEPDYLTNENGSTMDVFLETARMMQSDPFFDSMRISGGNTLDSSWGVVWYDYLKEHLDEGNTHQLAGTFDDYAALFETARADGKMAMNDELHNVMEAMVGVEYGMQTGIWWGTANLARGEFVKASDGVRLGYAEHRPFWTSASVYRAPNGKVQAFGGTSERQATRTIYNFVSLDRDVYFGGQGPTREYSMMLPGGAGYWDGQTNAETVVDITWGDDIEQPIDGDYVLVNRESQMVLQVAGGSSDNAVGIQQGAYTESGHQQWKIVPQDERVGGDFSYFKVTALHSGKGLDINNFSLLNGGDLIQYELAGEGDGDNQQWYFDYAGDGWFHICSRFNAKCVEVDNSGTGEGANIHQWDKRDSAAQQWRLLPLGADIEFEAPQAPMGLSATAMSESILLEWHASSESDLAGYTVLRATTTSGPYNTIARDVTDTSFVDNSVVAGNEYFYVIRAEDQSLNRSALSAEVQGSATNEAGLVAHLTMDGDLQDSSENLNHAASVEVASFVSGKMDQAVGFDGSDSFLQLPYTLTHRDEMTVSAWVNWQGNNTSERLFDFGNNEDHYLYLTPATSGGMMRLAVKNGGVEQLLEVPALPSDQWVHLAVTIGVSGASIYVDGERMGEASLGLTPMDIQPVRNYLGRGQGAQNDFLFEGLMDDIRLYNYALTASEVAGLVSM